MSRTENAIAQIDAAYEQMRRMNKRVIRILVEAYGAENVSVVHDSVEARIPKKEVVR